MSEFDLVVRNGTVVNGLGTPGVPGDVAVRGGHIVEVGEVRGSGTAEIDASGLVVSPGFIDLHTHLDVQLFFDRTLLVSPWHGVTTVTMGSCGLGIAPTRPEDRELILRNLQHVEGMDYSTTSAGMGDDWGFETFPEFMDLIDQRSLAINTITQIGHVALKMYVVGDEASERIATDDERARMRALSAEALRAGAWGFSTDQTDAHFGEGGVPIASRVTTELELRELVATLHEIETGIFTMATGSFLTPQLFADLIASVPHIHTHGRNPNVLAKNSDHRQRIAFHERLHAHGFRNHMQFSCLPMQFEASLLDPFFPFIDVPPQLDAEPASELIAPIASMESSDERMAAYRADGFRERFREITSGPNWSRVFEGMNFSVVPSDPTLEQRNVGVVADERGVAPVDLLLDLQFEAYPEVVRFNLGFYNFDDDEVGRVLQHPLVLPGNSDAGAHVAQVLDARFPTYMLAKYVRNRDDLSLEWAIRKLTSESAQSLGLTDRGALLPGLKADIVVLDPETVQDGPVERRFDFPADGSHLVSEGLGIEHVIVNGTPIREHGRDLLEPDGPMPGRLLRSTPSART